jgi:hypothetical protein
MNILYVLSQYEVTGAETFAIALANEQVRAGHDVLIVSDNLHLKTEATVLLRPIGKRDYLHRIRNISTLKTIFRKKKIDVIQAHLRAGHIRHQSSRGSFALQEKL